MPTANYLQKQPRMHDGGTQNSPYHKTSLQQADAKRKIFRRDDRYVTHKRCARERRESVLIVCYIGAVN